MASLSDLDSEDEARQSASSEARQSASPGAVHTEGSGVVSPTARWRGWWLRLSMTALMIAGCFGLVYVTRQAGVVLLIIALQTGIYRELVRIASVDSKERALPGFAYFYWYWFGVAAFFIYTWTLQPYLLSGLAGVPLVRVPPAALGAAAKPYWKPSLDPTADVASAVLTAGNAARSAALFVVQEYVPIGFALYCAGLIAFVFSLRQRRNFRYQFGQFAYCHVALLAVVFQSTFLSALVFNGLIWFFLPCGLVVCNDSCSYVAGAWRRPFPAVRMLCAHPSLSPCRLLLRPHATDPLVAEEDGGGLCGWGTRDDRLLRRRDGLLAVLQSAGHEVPHALPRHLGRGQLGARVRVRHGRGGGRPLRAAPPL
jgi:CDP-diglyceride synthetase